MFGLRSIALPVLVLSAVAWIGFRPSPAAASRGPADGSTSRPEDRGQGDVAEPARYRVPRAASEVRVDARLDEEAWTVAPVIRVPWEWSPAKNEPAPVKTECRVTFDDDTLYLGCRAHDPEPSEIRAHLADRDTPFQDDYVSFLLDTFHDSRRAFEFRVNPLGVQMDARYSDGSRDFSWDGIWNSEGRITGEGYVVEIAVPFASLNFPDRSDTEHTWGVIVGRSWPRSAHHRLRSIRTDFSNSCLLCQADDLVGLRGIRSGHRVELDPTVTTKRTDVRPSPSAPGLETGGVQVKPGITGQWGVTPNLTLQATANPDFSQVEADAAKLETNRRFALFFPEKRPFFLEGADIFQVPGNLVFTRTVVDPVAGAKFTGKAGPHTVGAFVTVDEVNNLLFPGALSSRRTLLTGEGSRVTTGVARYLRDVGESSAVGGLVTVRAGDGYHNLMASSDGSFQAGNGTRIAYGVAGSLTDYPDPVASRFGQPAGEFGGVAAFGGGNHRTRNWNAWANLVHLGPEYRADAGFVQQTGARGGQFEVVRSLWGGDRGWLTRLRVGVEGSWFERPDGQDLVRLGEVLLAYDGPLQTSVRVDNSFREQFFAGRLFSFRQHDVSVGLEPSGAFSVEVEGTVGEEIDFANARLGDLVRVGPEVTWRAGRHLRLEASHDLERLVREGRQVFEAILSQTRAVYHFSAEAFLRAVVQCRDVNRNPAMYGHEVEPHTRSLFGQLLFSYEVNPRTVLFMGYTDDRAARTGRPLAQSERTFFFKVGYAWRP